MELRDGGGGESGGGGKFGVGERGGIFGEEVLNLEYFIIWSNIFSEIIWNKLNFLNQLQKFFDEENNFFVKERKNY